MHSLSQLLKHVVKILAGFAILPVLGTMSVHASERFVQKLAIAPGLVAVVSEGDLEARSIGSYAVRVYFDSAASSENDTTFYTAGLIRAREGAVVSIAPLQVAWRKYPLLLVVIQSVGTGGYISADALSVGRREIRLLANVANLGPDQDPAKVLLRKLARKK